LDQKKPNYHLSKFQLYPFKELPNTPQDLSKYQTSKSDLELISNYKKDNLNTNKKEEGETKQKDGEPYVQFFGTSGAASTKWRNESCVYFHSGKANVILDCGEGSFNQFKRSRSPTQYIEDLKNLKMALISHKHPDHCRGLVSFLIERAQLLNLSKKNKSEIHDKNNHKCETCGFEFTYKCSRHRHSFIHNPETLEKKFIFNILTNLTIPLSNHKNRQQRETIYRRKLKLT